MCRVMSFEHHHSPRGSRWEIWPRGWQHCHIMRDKKAWHVTGTRAERGDPSHLSHDEKEELLVLVPTPCHLFIQARRAEKRSCYYCLLPSSDLSSPSSLSSLLWFWMSLLLLFSWPGPSAPSSPLSHERWCSLQYRPSSLRAKKSPAVNFLPQATHTKHCRGRQFHFSFSLLAIKKERRFSLRKWNVQHGR